MIDQEPMAQEECNLFLTRGSFLILCLASSFGISITRLWDLQVKKGETYLNYANGNRIRLAPEAAPRGFIYDRYHRPLADNRPVYELSLIREDTPNLEVTLRNLAYVLQRPYQDLKKIVDQNRDSARFRPIVLQTDLSYEQAVLLETYENDFLGATINILSRRYYPYQGQMSHVLGYVSQRQKNQTQDISKEKKFSAMVIGQTGIEKIGNDTLVGTDGGKQVEVDYVGRALHTLGQRVAPVPGEDISLTIDIDLQTKINEWMQGNTGAVLVMRPKTGEVLAMASFPTFNPNLFSDGVSHADWQKLLNHPEHPLENKAIQGIYSPGSIFKIVTAYAALDSEIVDPSTTHQCPGFFYIKGRKTPFKCWAWRKGGHGTVNLKKAIKESCNVYFYKVALELGIDRLAEYAKMFGFGQKTEVILPNEKIGILPNSEWKLKALKEQWFHGETLTVAIGQGYLNVTPIQVANFVNILVNDGHVVKPKLLLSQPIQYQKQHQLNPDYLKLLKEAMIAAVQEKNGTARILNTSQLTIAAKTGTAQVIGHDSTRFWSEEKRKQKDYQAHSWIAAFTPDHPEISVVVLVEHGGSGASVSGPIASKIFDYYSENLRGKLIDEADQKTLTKSLNHAFDSDS